MPSATSRATAGATIARSSSPSVPSSPACGLSPAIASRGRAMPKCARQVMRHDAAGFDNQFGRKLLEDVLERQMDCHRNDRKFRRPQHHHRPQRLAGRFLHQLGQKFGVAGLGEAPTVKHVLGDRIGDYRGGRARQHVGNRAANRGDGRRRARPVRAAGFGAHRRHRWQQPEARRERPRRLSRCHGGDRNVEAEPRGAAGEKIRIADEIKWRECQARRADARRKARDRDRCRRARRGSMPKVARHCFTA